jgi:hypothetical protein
MAQCKICSSEKAKEVNRWILSGRQEKETAAQFGFDKQTIGYHKRHHLPFRSRRVKKAETVDEKFAELEFELSRLRVLALSGEKVGEALRVVIAQRNLLELEMRKEGGLDATHKKLILNAHPPAGDVEVTFQGGRVKAVEVGK